MNLCIYEEESVPCSRCGNCVNPNNGDDKVLNAIYQGDPADPLWYRELSKINQLPQAQDSLADQIDRARIILNKFGLYDVADYLRPKEDPKCLK